MKGRNNRAIPSEEIRRRIDWFNTARLESLSTLKAMEKSAHALDGPLLDVGCGQKPYQFLFSHVEFYIGLQPVYEPTVDILGDAHHIPFGDCTVNSVICNQTLLLLKEPCLFFSEAFRVLRPGGKILVTAAQCWGSDGADYFRFTGNGLRHMAESTGFKVSSIEPRGGKWMLIGTRLSSAIYRSSRYRRFTRVTLRMFVLFICGLVQSFFGYLDMKDFDPSDTLGWKLLAEKPS